MKDLRDKGIQTQIGTYALHLHKAFNNYPHCRIEGELSSSRYAFEHCLTLPLYHEMTEEEQGVVVENLKEISSKLKAQRERTRAER